MSERRLRLLMLQQGDPGKAASAGSGSPYFLRRAMERRGVEVMVANCEPEGLGRYLLAARTLTRPRPGWVAQFHIAPAALRLRSRLARERVARQAGRVDAVIQYGSEFHPGLAKPFFCFNDNFIANTVNEPRSWARQLPPPALERALLHERRLFDDAAGVFTFSRMVKEGMHRHFDLPDDKVVVTHPGPNFAHEPAPVPMTERASSPTVLFIGRDWEAKGGPEMLAAFTRVRSSIPEARLVVAGPRATPSALGPGVEFLGYLSKDVPEDAAKLEALFRQAWVFCLPTRYESFGMSYVEAMWYGLPAIGTRAWAVPEIISDGETGYTIPLDDVDLLASRIAHLLSDSGARAEMGRAGRARAERRFSWDATADIMIRTALRRLPGGQHT